MSDTADLMAMARDRVGKGAARELRRNNMVPAVIYGDKKPPLSIAVPYKDVFLRINGGGFLTTVISIEVNGEKHSVLPKDFQLEVVRDLPLHVDFLRVSSKTMVTVDIPVRFENESDCPGLVSGGVLNIVRHTIECVCPAGSIPDAISVDLTPFDMGDSINISNVTMPASVEPTITDRDFTVATIAAPAAVKTDEELAEEEAAALEAAEMEAAEETGEGEGEGDEES